MKIQTATAMTNECCKGPYPLLSTAGVCVLIVYFWRLYLFRPFRLVFPSFSIWSFRSQAGAWHCSPCSSVPPSAQELGDRLLASISTCATADALQKQATTFKTPICSLTISRIQFCSSATAIRGARRQACRSSSLWGGGQRRRGAAGAAGRYRCPGSQGGSSCAWRRFEVWFCPVWRQVRKTVSALEQRQSVQQSALLRLDELLLDKASKFETSSMHRQILELVSQSRHRQLEQKVEEQARKLEMSLSNHRRQHSPPSLPFQQQQFRYDVDPNQVPATERMAEHVDGQAMVDPAVDFDELPNSDKPYLGSGAPSARVLSGPSSSSPSFSTAPSSSAPAATTLALISDIQRQLAMKADGVDFERLRQTAASASTAASLAAATEQNQKQLELLAQLTFRLAKLTIDQGEPMESQTLRNQRKAQLLAQCDQLSRNVQRGRQEETASPPPYSPSGQDPSKSGAAGEGGGGPRVKVTDAPTKDAAAADAAGGSGLRPFASDGDDALPNARPSSVVAMQLTKPFAARRPTQAGGTSPRLSSTKQNSTRRSS
eukprot:GHVT01006283.1.p1 GENE.GHVT01006283.1~~GHVT01006283.1.p1  ORF type:complete len:545 (+),score=110.94 GHVT01006283.1:1895-3529(+)